MVMFLAVGPASAFACELWCSTPAADIHHRAVGCHDASLATSTDQQIVSTARCDGAAVMTPFISEARQAESGYGAAAPPVLLHFGSIPPDNDESSAPWSVFNVQTPGVPASRAVLRI
jgi:hypothetical protein